MKKLIFMAVILLGFIASTNTYALPKINQPAPDFRLPAAGGETVSLSDYKGKYVILEWTNHQCPFVSKHYSSDNMQQLQRKYTDQGAVWLSIISSARGNQGHVSSEMAMSLTKSRNASPSEVLLDEEGKVGRLYGAKTTPHMFIIKPDGNLAYMGAIDSIRSANPKDISRATNYVSLAMNELAEGKMPSRPMTRPYGCSVKY